MGGLQHRCQALVLRRIDYGEADRIVSLLTAEQGLQKAFARSARKSRKRFGAMLEPFSQLIVHYRAGRGNFWFLEAAELVNSRTGLRSDFQRLGLASYGIELVELLLEEAQPQPQVYELLCSYLDFLAQGGDGEVARLLYELRLVYLLGYIPHFLHCSLCLKIFADETIRFDASRGGSLCLDCSGGSGAQVGLGTIGSLARTLNVAPRRFSGFRFGRQTLEEGRVVLSQVLAQVLPRPPKSLRFLP